MVFVHSRKDTVKTAEALLEAAAADGQEALFASRDHPKAQLFRRDVSKSKNRDVGRLFPMGLGVHHAGMLRSDRTLTERMFEAGVLKVIVCTATLAWGVNLPAHTVIIKGTQVYNADRGGFTDVSILDVQQVFGRAGRPQYDTSGLGIILTSHDKMAHYLRLMTQQAPIESRFVQALPDHLNAEIVSGTVTSVRDAVRWLAYTYLYVRMCRNPMAYGISYEEAAADPTLAGQRDALVRRAAARLDECRMIRYDPRSGTLAATHLGRVASHFYLQHDTIECFNEAMRPHMTMAQAVELVCRAGEFEQLRVREEELEELERLRRECPLKVEGGITGPSAKANVLLQCHISWRRPHSFTLISDTNYVAKNSGRVARGLFEICVRRGWSTLAERMLTVCKAVDWRVWWFQTPLRQFPHAISHEVCVKVERAAVSVGDLVDMSEGDVGAIIHHHRLGSRVRHLACQVPHLHLDARVQPLSRSILRMTLTLAPDFTWSDRAHGSSQQWHIWVLDAESEHIYHSEVFTLHRRQMRDEPQVLAFAIPIFEPLPPQYFVRAVNDHWLGSETTLPVSFHHLMLPDAGDRYTELQDLQPLPTHALRNAKHERMFPFSHFNAVQTQLFWAAFHSDKSLFLGAPTGSGKTVVAELAILRMLRAYPGKKAVYIAPLKVRTGPATPVHSTPPR